MSRKKKSILDRRISTLEQEAEKLRDNIRSLSKSVAKSTRATQLNLRLGEYQNVAPFAGSDHTAPDQASAEAARGEKTEPVKGKANGEQSRVKPLAVFAPHKRYKLYSDEEGAPSVPPAISVMGLSQRGLTKQQKRVQRNKALFMLVVVLVALYVLIKLI